MVSIQKSKENSFTSASRISRFKRVSNKLKFIGRLLDKQLSETNSKNTCGQNGDQGFDAEDSQIGPRSTNRLPLAPLAEKLVLKNDPSAHPNLTKYYSRHKFKWDMRRNCPGEQIQMAKESFSSVLPPQVDDLKQSSAELATARLHQRKTNSSLTLAFSKRAAHLSASQAFGRASSLFENNVKKKSIEMFRKEVSSNMELQESVFVLRRAHIFCAWKYALERQVKQRAAFRHRIDVKLCLKVFESWKVNKRRRLDSHMHSKYQELLKKVFFFWRDELKTALMDESLKNEIKETLRSSIRI